MEPAIDVNGVKDAEFQGAGRAAFMLSRHDAADDRVPNRR